jgi:oxalate decarboxylase
MPIARELAIVNMRLKAGAVRELHWHNETEWGYVLKGQMRITAIDEEGHAFQDDISEGNIWKFPAGIPHSLQGLQCDGCEFILLFDDGNFNEDETFLLTDFLAHIPMDVLAKNFGVPASAFGNIPKEELYIFESDVPGPARGV